MQSFYNNGKINCYAATGILSNADAIRTPLSCSFYSERGIQTSDFVAIGAQPFEELIHWIQSSVSYSGWSILPHLNSLLSLHPASI